MLGLGLKVTTVALRKNGGTQQPPSPLSLQLAAWYDPSDLGTLFQDTAGTVPVSADGDPVARMEDKSGNGHHMTQADPARQPVYHTAGGAHWIESDGTDDSLSTPSRMGFSTNPDITVIAGLSVLSAQQNAERLLHLGAISESGSLGAALGTAGASWRFNNGNAIFATTPLNTPFLGRWSRGSGSNYGSSYFALNGVDQTQNSAVNAASIPSGTGHEAHLFAEGNTTSFTLQAQMFGLLIGAFSDPAQISNGEAWMAQKTGIALP